MSCGRATAASGVVISLSQSESPVKTTQDLDGLSQWWFYIRDLAGHYITCLEKQTLLICCQDTGVCFLGDGLAISLIST